MNRNAKDKKDATEQLKKWLATGDTVYFATYRNASGTNSMRAFGGVFVVLDGRIKNITWQVSVVLGIQLSRNRNRNELRARGGSVGSVIPDLSHHLFGSSSALNSERID